MKKFLTVVLAVLALVSLFAATIKVSDNLSVIVGGTVNFQFLADKNGIDANAWIDGSLTSGSTWGRLQFSFSGATFRWLTGTSTLGGSFDLRQVKLSNKYFNVQWDKYPYFVLDEYLAGQDSDGNAIFGGYVFNDGVLFTTPFVKDLVIRFVDTNNKETTDDTPTWFSDYVVVQYPLAGWKLTGAVYRETSAPETHEFGVSASGALDLGLVKPNVRVFAGYVYNGTKMAVAYDLFTNFEYKLGAVKFVPEFKYGDNLNYLNYKSTYINNSKYVSLNTVYEDTFKPVKVTVDLTPKFDIAEASPILAINAVQAVVDLAPTTVTAKLYNEDVIAGKPFGLYGQLDLNLKPAYVGVFVNVPDLTDFANYEYVHFKASYKVQEDLTLTGNFRMVPDKMGYNAYAVLQFTDNYYLKAIYGTLADDDATITDSASWYVKLFYQAAF